MKIILILLFLKPIDGIESPDNCGMISQTARKFIIGGNTADTAEFPFMASLQYKSWHTCGATILNKRWLLTAAHCLTDRKAEDFLLIIGTTDLTKDRYEYKVEKYISNGCFDGKHLVNDIALLMSDRDIIPLESDPQNVGSVCLPEMDSEPIERLLFTTGWGLTSPTGYPTKVLKKAEITLYSEQYCIYAEYFTNLGYAELWLPLGLNLCARSFTSSLCGGDSGGPAFVIRNGRVYQLGIISGGITFEVFISLNYKCWTTGEPMIFTKVSKYLDWIDKSVSNYSKSTQTEIKTNC